jgi:hypothetical protein
MNPLQLIPHRNVWKHRFLAILCGNLLLLSANYVTAADSTMGGKINIDAKSFRCMTKMTKAGQFYVDNFLGNLDATLAIANSKTGGKYPPGSVIQLVPTEVMVKRETGFNSVTHDWEFFELDVSKHGFENPEKGVCRSRQSLWRKLLWLATSRLARSGI